jgi:broad specificity phosphatase PhoE
MPSELTSTRLLVLRHGQSEWNAQGRWQGHADVALDDVGRTQAREAAERVAALGPFAAVWTSDLLRAAETAETIAARCGGIPVRLDARLRETHVGPWEGLNHHEVERGWPGYLAERRRPDGFEPYDAAASRVLACFADIASIHHGATVLAISHGGVIRATRRVVGAIDHNVPNLGGSWFTVGADGTVTAGEIVTPGDTQGGRRVRERTSEVL